MQVSSAPLDQEAITQSAIRWLTRVLDDPGLSYSTFPSELKCYLYIDGIPKQLAYGSWQINGDVLYLPGRSASISQLDKLCILAAIASYTKASLNTVIVEKIAHKLTICISETVRSVYGSIITSMHRPTRLAIDQENFQVAAEIGGSWMLTNGTPVGVTDKWIIMDF